MRFFLLSIFILMFILLDFILLALNFPWPVYFGLAFISAAAFFFAVKEILPASLLGGLIFDSLSVRYFGFYLLIFSLIVFLADWLKPRLTPEAKKYFVVFFTLSALSVIYFFYFIFHRDNFIHPSFFIFLVLLNGFVSFIFAVILKNAWFKKI
ncbi:MAG: hypothetical protein HYV52_03130 [Parcubacteria group bacterium]|nr:hypothetical protein [Parcubacteria group bacterium]